MTDYEIRALKRWLGWSAAVWTTDGTVKWGYTESWSFSRSRAIAKTRRRYQRSMKRVAVEDLRRIEEKHRPQVLPVNLGVGEGPETDSASS